MAIFFFLPLLLTATTLFPTSLSSSHTHHLHHRHRHQPLSPTPPPPPLRQQQQLTDLISALSSTSDFQSWATILLSSAPIPSVPATLFVPSDMALSHLPTWFDPLLVPYHVVPNTRLDYSQLTRLAPLSRLPTILPDHYLLLTNTSVSNFTVDDSLITRPNLFLSPNFAVHGIRNVLQYSLYREAHEGNGTGTIGTGFLPLPPPSHPSPPTEVEYGLGSCAAAADEFPTVFLLVFFTVVLV